MKKKYDFSGWASRNNIKCSDGRVIRKDAFKNQDGKKVPLVWNHNHNDAENVLGHALLENREEGLYAYCSFNEREQGQNAKELVKHGDITSLSIYANKLRQKGSDVIHGCIREVSLVLAGANPGAYIETVLSHNDGDEEEVKIFNPSEELIMSESQTDDLNENEKNKNKENIEVDVNKKTESDKTIKDVIDEMTEEQKNVLYAMIGLALEEQETKKETEKGEKGMKQNAFEKMNEENNEDVLSHSEMIAMIDDAKKNGSLKETMLAHGITDIEVLFPDARNVSNMPETIKEDDEWVNKIMKAIKKSPFSRIKSSGVNVTEDEARAKGYIKGKQKVEEVIKALKRTTTPTTVYKLQKLDRDDILDITDFDVVSYLKKEMREKLNEELARAFLIGDQRIASDDDKINEGNIRPVLGDSSVYTIPRILTKAAGDTDGEFAKAFITDVIKSRKQYKGSGNPTLFTTEDMLTDMLLIEDSLGRAIYDTTEKLITKLRVKEIVTVPPMVNAIRTDDAEEFDYKCLGILVNLGDYVAGADKGGEVNFFDDFDLNFNKYEYLIETRCCGALVKPHAAITFEEKVAHVAG